MKQANSPVSDAQTTSEQQLSSAGFSVHNGSFIAFPLLTKGVTHLSVQSILPFIHVQTDSQSSSILSPLLYVKPPLIHIPGIVTINLVLLINSEHNNKTSF